MNKNKQIGVIIITSIIILISWISIDYSSHIVSYASISDIKLYPTKYINKSIRVPGFLKNGQFSSDNIKFSFYIYEHPDSTEGIKVIHNNAPEIATTAENSQIIVIGNYENNKILATQVLTKCSSKYEDEN